MSQTGSFGDIVFDVSSGHVRTWSGFRREHSVNFARHEVAQNKARLEFTGISLKQLDFEVQLSAALGSDPEADIQALQEIIYTGEPQVLVIGGRPQGEYVLESITEERLRTDGRGRTILARVNLAFTEYH